MARTSNVFARVGTEIKEQAKSVLSQLGISCRQLYRAISAKGRFKFKSGNRSCKNLL